jgi:energy-coupling factor transporter ATP-binding protein EcfA2
MKITKITLEGFRAFDAPFELDLGAGKNLLLHGENGSGKSSIYLALKRFFEERGDDIAKHRNHFSPASRDSRVTIHVKGKDSAGAAFDRDVGWNLGDTHPLCIPTTPTATSLPKDQRQALVDGAHRAGFLDYRAMLRTHLLSGPLPRSSNAAAAHAGIYGAIADGLDSQLFDLVARVILAGTSATIPGGTVARVGELIGNVWDNLPATWHRRNLENANNHANTFNAGFNTKLMDLETKLADFLKYFGNHSLDVKFPPVAIAWDKATRALVGAELKPEITFRGKPVSDHHQFLNEARLSALAICLFLAGVALADNDYANPEHPRFLVLDDALIGLDLQHRLPVLDILKTNTFQHHQVFLFTHDRVWFDLARAHLPEGNGWYHRELQADESTGSLVPKMRQSKADLAVARLHLANGDLKAAAVYARSAFEWKLRKACDHCNIRIAFNPDASKVDANTLWTGIKERQTAAETQRLTDPTVVDFIPRLLINDVDVIRSNVLNKLSHFGSSSLVEPEVQAAIDTLDRLIAHTFVP